MDTRGLKVLRDAIIYSVWIAHLDSEQTQITTSLVSSKRLLLPPTIVARSNKPYTQSIIRYPHLWHFNVVAPLQIRPNESIMAICYGDFPWQGRRWRQERVYRHEAPPQITPMLHTCFAKNPPKHLILCERSTSMLRFP